jgi:hypothetical protein
MRRNIVRFIISWPDTIWWIGSKFKLDSIISVVSKDPPDRVITIGSGVIDWVDQQTKRYQTYDSDPFHCSPAGIVVSFCHTEYTIIKTVTRKIICLH